MASSKDLRTLSPEHSPSSSREPSGIEIFTQQPSTTPKGHKVEVLTQTHSNGMTQTSIDGKEPLTWKIVASRVADKVLRHTVGRASNGLQALFHLGGFTVLAVTVVIKSPIALLSLAMGDKTLFTEDIGMDLAAMCYLAELTYRCVINFHLAPNGNEKDLSLYKGFKIAARLGILGIHHDLEKAKPKDLLTYIKKDRREYIKAHLEADRNTPAIFATKQYVDPEYEETIDTGYTSDDASYATDGYESEK